MNYRLNFVYFGEFEGPVYDVFMEAAASQDVYDSYHAPSECAKFFGSVPDTLNVFRDFDDKH